MGEKTGLAPDEQRKMDIIVNAIIDVVMIQTRNFKTKTLTRKDLKGVINYRGKTFEGTINASEVCSAFGYLEMENE